MSITRQKFKCFQQKKVALYTFLGGGNHSLSQHHHYVKGICCGTGHPGHPTVSTTGQSNQSVLLINKRPTFNCIIVVCAIKKQNTEHYLLHNAPSRESSYLIHHDAQTVDCETDVPSSAHGDTMHAGAPHTLYSCSDIINTPWIKQLWQPPESPDAAGRTSVDLAADLGALYCGPAMIILGPF